MFDRVHPKTLSAVNVVETSWSNGEYAYRDLTEVVMECGQKSTALHLKVAITASVGLTISAWN